MFGDVGGYILLTFTVSRSFSPRGMHPVLASVLPDGRAEVKTHEALMAMETDVPDLVHPVDDNVLQQVEVRQAHKCRWKFHTGTSD